MYNPAQFVSRWISTKTDDEVSPEEKIKLAIEKIDNGELSYRQAESMYGIPRSTLYDHKTGKASTNKRGPPTVLTSLEEDNLVQWIQHMADIRYDRTQEQVCLTVKRFLINMVGKILLKI